jgi:hypothetical protein
MDGLRPYGFSQRGATIRIIRKCGGSGSGSRAPDVFYGGAADCDAAEFFEDQRFIFLAGEASDD